MDQTLALFNIRAVKFLTSNNTYRNYAFTSKMLANEIFIEYFFSDPHEDQDEEFEDELIENDTEDLDYGSQLSVVMKHKNKYYQFLMYHDCMEIGSPIMVLQTVIFLVKLIEDLEPAQLIEHLYGLAPDPLIPHQIPEKEFKDAANKMLKLKIQKIHNLIETGRADLN